MVIYRIYTPGTYSISKIKDFLILTNQYFIPPTSQRTNISVWSEKIFKFATIFEVKDEDKVVGLGATYVNVSPDYSYGTFVCVLKEYQADMIGVDLICRMIDYSQDYGSYGFRCEIRKSNKALVRFYKSLGFEVEKEIHLDVLDEVDLIIHKKF